jgi:acylpyruvate hydrolase
MGKTFDGTGAFGPELVTRDELPRGCGGLGIRTILNGEVMQEANTKDMIFGVATLVAILSEAMTLSPGDVIVTGTPGGVGALREPQVWMKPGDECTVEIDRIGSLTNPVVQETPR